MLTKYPGLTTSEAEQLQKQHGLNLLPEQKQTPRWLIFVSQFKSSLVVLLLAAALISLLLGEVLDTVFILVIVILNAFVGYYQEIKAKNEITALKKLVVEKVRAIRNGSEQLLDSKYLLPGDLVNIGEGDKIPADGLLLNGQNLNVNEASLTGEAIPVVKNSNDPVFMATTVLSGHGQMKVLKIAAETKFGQIALSLSQIAEEKTPLELKLADFGKKLTMAVVLITFAIGLSGIMQGRDPKLLFFTAVALAVAAIPEGLPAVLTIALAVGTGRLAKRGAIIKRLVATEALGSIDVILTDKTGTLTKNEMTVKEIYTVSGNHYSVDGVGYNTDGKIKNSDGTVVANFTDPDLKKILEVCALDNSSSLAPVEDGGNSFAVLGDTTEGSLLVLVKKAGIDYDELRQSNPILEEIPFDSRRKLTTVLIAGEMLTKGAHEKILEISHNLTSKEKEAFLEKAKYLGAKGYRILGFAHKKLETGTKPKKSSETNLNFLGLVAIFDPPRPEVRDAISYCQTNGITTVMMTGDFPETGRAIGEEIGLLQKGQEVITGEQLELYTDEILVQNLNRIGIFARITPSDKLRIVEAYQKLGKVVAVTGDGVNDSPALKKANIGVAMGITGTDVSKEAADLIITDDNFSTIVAAIEEGKIIYANLTCAIKYLLASNLSEVVLVFSAILIGFPLPISPLAILWLNIATDGLPALALAVDKHDSQIFHRFRKAGFTTNFLNTRDFWQIFTIGSLIASIVLVVFWLLYPLDLANARLITFTVLVVLQLSVAFLVRQPTRRIADNKILFFAVAAALIAQVIMLFVPFFRNRFI